MSKAESREVEVVTDSSDMDKALAKNTTENTSHSGSFDIVDKTADRRVEAIDDKKMDKVAKRKEDSIDERLP